MVYYANYLKFCERSPHRITACARVTEHGLLDARGIVFVVRSVRADYLAPARLDDALAVSARIASRRRASLSFEHEDPPRRRTPLHRGRLAMAALSCGAW